MKKNFLQCVETRRATSLRRNGLSMAAAVMMLFATGAGAQVTIGSGKIPESFSTLEIVSQNRQGLRLPQIETTARRDEIFTNAAGFQANPLALGLQIFNMETRCVETWNGTVWITQCPPEGPYVPSLPPGPPITTIPAGTGTTNWATNAWVGAFWRNDQTGERIIRSTNSTPWTVTVDPEYTSWVVVDNARENPTLWKDGVTPDDAELHQVSGSNTLSGTGDILFRFGLKSKNPDPEPRYATATLKINGTDYKLFLRQGEAADYVYRPEDPATGATTTRPLAVRFSPYNLTDPNLNETTVLSNQTAINGGKFVDFPTQAGAFWQWGTDISNTATYTPFVRRAYHPVNPTGASAIWDSDSSYPTANNVWSEFTGANRLETCPEGWRRPMMKDDNIATEPSTSAPANASELMQSLFYDTVNGASGSATDLYYGYYADGFFDRYPIVNASGTAYPAGAANSAVNTATKDVAYRGMLITNPFTNAGLFIPAAGYRNSGNGGLQAAGVQGNAWSSSAYSASQGWLFRVGQSYIYNNVSLTYDNHTWGYSVRCVSDN